MQRIETEFGKFFSTRFKRLIKTRLKELDKALDIKISDDEERAEILRIIKLVMLRDVQPLEKLSAKPIVQKTYFGTCRHQIDSGSRVGELCLKPTDSNPKLCETHAPLKCNVIDCERKISDRTRTGLYCRLHYEYEYDPPNSEIRVKKSRYGNEVHALSGLAFDEKDQVIGYEDIESGDIKPLDTDCLEIVRRHGLAYHETYNSRMKAHLAKFPTKVVFSYSGT